MHDDERPESTPAEASPAEVPPTEVPPPPPAASHPLPSDEAPPEPDAERLRQRQRQQARTEVYPRPRLGRTRRGAVAAAGLVGLVVMVVLTLRYSRETLEAARQARPAPPASAPVALSRLEQLGLPEAQPPAEPEPEAPPAVPALPWPPPSPERSSETRAAMRSALVAGRGEAGSGAGAAGRQSFGSHAGFPGGDLTGGESLTALEAELRRLEELGALDAPGGRGAVAALAAAAAPAPAAPAERPATAGNLLQPPVRPGSALDVVVPRAPPPGLHLAAGTFIPAVLTHRLVSDQPGLVQAVVSRDVLDSTTAARVVIPHGSRLLGRQGSLPSLGQARLAVVWTRLVLPDGRAFDFADGEPSAARDGSSGLPGRVRSHWARRFGAAALVSLVGAGVQLSQPQGRGDDRVTPGETAAGALGLELGRISEEILRRTVDLPPTIELAPGARLHVVLTRDLSFPVPPSLPASSRSSWRLP